LLAIKKNITHIKKITIFFIKKGLVNIIIIKKKNKKKNIAVLSPVKNIRKLKEITKGIITILLLKLFFVIRKYNPTSSGNNLERKLPKICSFPKNAVIRSGSTFFFRKISMPKID